jgi:hypothetical protein
MEKRYLRKANESGVYQIRNLINDKVYIGALEIYPNESKWRQALRG